MAQNTYIHTKVLVYISHESDDISSGPTKRSRLIVAISNTANAIAVPYRKDSSPLDVADYI